MHHLPLYESTIAELYKLRCALDAVIAGYEHEDINLLKTIPGCGEVSSKTVYTAVSTIKRFPRAKQLTSYCGMDWLRDGDPFQLLLLFQQIKIFIHRDGLTEQEPLHLMTPQVPQKGLLFLRLNSFGNDSQL